MQELVILGQLGPFTLTAYGLCLMIGAAAAVILTACLGRRTLSLNASLSMSMAAMVGAILGGRILYCLTMIADIMVDFGGVPFMLQLWQGGYTMYGAILGGLAGIVLYARATKLYALKALDLAAPGAALAIAVGRAGEYFTSLGVGHYVETEALQRFPFAVQSVFEDWQLPVFAYEALAAVIILIVCLRLMGKVRPGRVAAVFLVLISLCQVILESFRLDEFIRFGFVKFNMLAAALTMGTVFILSVVNKVKKGGWNAWQIIRVAVFAVGIVVVILIEFALDKSPIDNRLLYAVMAAILTLMGVAILREGK